ncbi:hypothetical protein PM10SUCC1_32940 [Propionigenium maris DSM 9537]|uniref:Nucleoid-associated protein n=1 Tax=Propionigenium maris DSM 9537 TaxID=1123000 RepID=A0A9W6GPG6_9FUSO|nr:nucleoid-associated protein [Propionigenium maris]GLI57780.1 hypothetical protein PM10SUCC1_32940 [Propionigenium maris DSM 9537]
MGNIFKTDKRREFQIPDIRNELLKKVLDCTNVNFHTTSKEVAEKLLEIEKGVDEVQRKRTTHGVKKGSLLQIEVKKKTITYLLITKIEHDEFLDEDSLMKKIGISFKKMEALKYFLLNRNSGIPELGDSNSKISTYWWKDFFGVLEVRDDAENTEKAIKKINEVINRKIRNFPEDVKAIKEHVRTFFRTQENFTLESFKAQVFGSYTPIKEGYSFKKSVEGVEKLVEGKKIDSSFTIDKEVLKKDVEKFDLGHGVHLTIPLDRENNTVSAVEEEGIKYIKIKVNNDSIYNKFLTE